MIYGIALGSNLGDRLGHLKAAVRSLLHLSANVQLLAAASIYETDPVDCPEGSETFYNTVIEIETSLDPLTLLQHLQDIQTSQGRPREHGYNTPRTVDLDILYADHLVLNHPDLTLPHPRMTQRRFVLQPLAEIRPLLMLPEFQKDISTLLTELDSAEPPLREVTKHWVR